MTAQAPLGYFSEPGYTSIGDPYASTEGKVGGKTEKLARYYGKQFATAPPKKGQAAKDVYFTEFKRLFEGEKYTNPGTEETKDRLEKGRAKISGDWRPNSPSKKMSGKGSYFGTIGDKFVHKAEHDVTRAGAAKFESSALPNIRTSPAKKGGFGVPGTTIQQDINKYESEPYDLARRQEREAMAEANRKRIGAAFKAMSHGNKDFNTCHEYKDGGLAPDDPFHKIKTEKFGTPFKPSSPAKSHPQLDTIETFPEYKEDPIAAKVAAQRDEMAAKKAKMGPTFKPTSGPKSTRTRPIRQAASY